MKIIIKIILLSLFYNSVILNGYAQSKLKIGHVKTNDILQVMPGRDSAQQALTRFANDLEQQLQIMMKEFETKYADYQANETKWTELVKRSKERELVDLQNRILEFQENAQNELTKKEAELTDPLIRRLQNAIREVAKERGYTYVFDASSNSLLYFEDGEDITPFVKRKLGIQ